MAGSSPEFSRRRAGSRSSFPNRTGENISRPDYLSGNPINSNYTQTLQYLNTPAFSAVPVSSASSLPIRPGNLGRGVIRGPGFWNVDLSLGKNFKIAEKVQFQIRLDAFNALNHTSHDELRLDRHNQFVLRPLYEYSEAAVSLNSTHA